MEEAQKTRILISLFAGILFTILALYFYFDFQFIDLWASITSEGYMYLNLLQSVTALSGLGFFLYSAFESQENRNYKLGLMLIILIIFSLVWLVVLNI